MGFRCYAAAPPRIFELGFALILLLLDTEYAKWFQHVWKIMTQSIAISEIKTLARFTVRTARPANGITMNDVIFDKSTLSGLNAAFKGVQGTRLRISGRAPPSSEINDQNAKRGMNAMALFAASFGALDALDLAFDHGPACGPICATILSNISLSKVTKLVIEGIDTPVSPLAHAIQRLESIKDFRISWYVWEFVEGSLASKIVICVSNVMLVLCVALFI